MALTLSPHTHFEACTHTRIHKRKYSCFSSAVAAFRARHSRSSAARVLTVTVAAAAAAAAVAAVQIGLTNSVHFHIIECFCCRNEEQI